jgi:peptide/nickel transport system substrate-binding protein
MPTKLLLSVTILALVTAMFVGLPLSQAAPPIRVVVNGVPLVVDVVPVIRQGRTMVPMRPIFEALGAQVHWDEATSSIRAYRREDAIVLELGNTTAWVNGPEHKMDVAPIAMAGRTMVPVRFVSEALGAQVEWVEATRAVNIRFTPYTPRPIGGTITFGSLADPINLNPILGFDAASWSIHRRTNHSLVRHAADLTIRNGIADRWVWDRERLTWTFWLRPEVRFSDGVPLTSRDVRFTFDTMGHPDHDGPRRLFVEHVAQITTEGDHIVRFHMTRPDAPFLDNISHVGIVPHHILGHVPVREHRAHPFSRQPVGAGPYLLDRFVPGQFVVLRRNPFFWMAPRPYIEQILIRRYADEHVMQAAFEAGDIDWMSLLPDELDRVRRELANRANFRDVPLHGFDYMGLNLEHPILRDRRVREALILALDRQAIVNTALGGHGVVLNSFQVTTSWAFGAPNLNPYAFNPAQARRLLDQAGWQVPVAARDGIRRRGGVVTGEPLTLSLIWNPPGSTIRRDVAAIAVRQWREIGIDASDLPLESAVAIDRFNRGRFDIMLIGRTLPPDPDPFLMFHSSQAERVGGRTVGLNRMQFRHAEVDRLIEEGARTIEIAARRAIYHRVDQILNYELPFIWLYQRRAVWATANRVRGITESPIGTVIDEAMYIQAGR